MCDSSHTSTLPISMSVLPAIAEQASLQFPCSANVSGRILGPYKDGTDNSRDLRYFAGAFFLARIVFVVLFGYLNSLLSVTLLGLVFSILLLMMAIFQPQKSKFHRNIDCISLFFLAVVCLIVIGGDFTPNHKTTYVITVC